MFTLEEMIMRHIDELQIAGTAVLLCVAMFGVSAVAPKDSKVSKGVTTFTEAPETAAEAEAQAQAEAEENGFPIYTQESNYDDSGSTDWDYDSGSYEEDPGNNNDSQDSSGDGSADGSGDGSADQDSSDNGDGSADLVIWDLYQPDQMSLRNFLRYRKPFWRFLFRSVP